MHAKYEVCMFLWFKRHCQWELFSTVQTQARTYKLHVDVSESSIPEVA